jgi:hypothetical protein
MILLAATLLAFIVGLLSGGKLGRLAHLPLRLPWLVLLAIAIQFYVIWTPPAMAPPLLSIPTGLLILSYLMLLIFVWINRRIAGMWAVGLGLLLNLTVMLANGGYMPITPEAVIAVGHQHEVRSMEAGARLTGAKDVLLPRDQTKLWPLSDVFVVARPFPIPSVFSAGDVAVALGVFILVLTALHRRPAQATAT